MKYSLAMLATGTLILAGCSSGPIDYAKAEPEVSLKAKRLYTDFSKNAELANQKYTGKIVQLDGAITRIEPQGDSLLVVVYDYSQSGTDGEGIRVTMLPGQNDKAKGLSKRYPVLIKGLCTGFESSNVIIEKGSLSK